MLNPSTVTIKGNVNGISKSFNKAAKRVAGKSPTQFSDIKVFIKSLPENLPTEQYNKQTVRKY